MKAKYVNGAFALTEGDKVLLFNPQLSTCAEIPLLPKKTMDESIEAFKSGLIDQFVILPEAKSQDYNRISDFFSKRDAYNTEMISITDAMSFDCNFSCVYCMQQNTNKGVDSLIPEERVHAWEVIQHAFNAQGIALCLFGGEPFFHIEYVEEILRLAKERGLQISKLCAVTNGSFADERVIKIIKKYGITALQITLDGPKEIHDSRRVAKASSSSYNTIVENIEIFIQETSARIIVNTVLDKQNCYHYLTMVDALICRFGDYILGDNPRIIFNVGNECHPINLSEYTSENKLRYNEQEVYFKNIFALLNKGVCINSPIPSPRCIATSVNEIVVGPNGNIYECISGIGNPEMLVSEYDEYRDNPAMLLVKQLMHKKHETTPRCSGCYNMALCNGGCRYNKIVEKRSSSCQKNDFSLAMDYYIRIAVHVDEILPEVYRLKQGVQLEA